MHVCPLSLSPCGHEKRVGLTRTHPSFFCLAGTLDRRGAGAGAVQGAAVFDVHGPRRAVVRERVGDRDGVGTRVSDAQDDHTSQGRRVGGRRRAVGVAAERVVARVCCGQGWVLGARARWGGAGDRWRAAEQWTQLDRRVSQGLFCPSPPLSPDANNVPPRADVNETRACDTMFSSFSLPSIPARMIPPFGGFSIHVMECAFKIKSDQITPCLWVTGA